MIYDKFSRCYKEGIDIGFVPEDFVDEHGKKHYKWCPGEEYSPGHMIKKCFSCPYLDKKNCKERKELAERVEFEHHLRERGIII